MKGGADEHKVRGPINYDSSDMIWLFTDASPTGTGQRIGKGPTRDTARPASCYSRKLMPSQRNYPTYQQETLAILEAMESFIDLLLHRHITVGTDHESLTKLITQKNVSGRQKSWLRHISKYNFEIEYQPGVKDILADDRSRNPWNWGRTWWYNPWRPYCWDRHSLYRKIFKDPHTLHLLPQV